MKIERNAFLIKLLAIIAIISSLIQFSNIAANEKDLFLSKVLSFRSAGVINPAMIKNSLSKMPRTELNLDEEFQATVPELWSYFFKNAIVKVGAIDSETPVALYYNPLVDVGVLTFWMLNSRRFHLYKITAFPGDKLRTLDVAQGLLPGWRIQSQDSPIDRLSKYTIQTLNEFKVEYPLQKREIVETLDTDHESELQILAEGRMMDYLIERTQITEKWVKMLAQEIELILKSKSAQYIVEKAPDTPIKTANTLEKLNAQYVSQLSVDLVVSINETDRLMLMSLPQDGDQYIAVICKMRNSICNLSVIQTFSLL